MTTTRRRETPALAEAFERLVRSHRSEIFRTVFRLSRNREDAEDLTQITFLNAYAALQRGARPEAPRAWLHAIARNAGSRRYRQQRIVEVELDEETSSELEDDVPTVGELQAALAQLTLNQRAALLMREVGGLSAREIATRLGISPGAVATLLFRARRALRAELEGTPEGRPVLGGLAFLGTGLRTVWLRLLGPAWESSPVLSRSGAAVGLAAAAAGVALLTTSAVPVPARAVHAVAHARVAGQVSHLRRAPLMHVSLPVEVRGAVQVATQVTRLQPHHARVAAPAPRAHVSSTPTARAESAPAERSVTKQSAPPATAAVTNTPAQPSQPAPAAGPAPAPQPVAQAQALVTSAAKSVPSPAAVTSAVTSATSAVTSATSPALPEAPVPPPVEAPAVTPPPVEPPALPPPPGGILPTG